MKKIGIVLINYQEKSVADTSECLTSLRMIEHEGFEYKAFVVCYGDDQSERVAQKIKAEFPEVDVVIESGNLGFAKGNNVGKDKALAWGADCILLLNNDTVVHSGFLLNLFTYMEANTSVGAVSPKIYFAKGNEYHKDRYQEDELGHVLWYAGGVIDWANIYGSHRGVDEVDRGQWDEVYDPDFISGCCVLVRRAVIEKVGFLNEELFMYWEDTDFSRRVLEVGFEIKYFPTAHIWHKNAGGSGVGSDLQDYFLNRNRLWFGFKYGSVEVKRALFKQSLSLWFNGSRWVRRAVMDYYFKRMRMGSWKS